MLTAELWDHALQWIGVIVVLSLIVFWDLKSNR